MWQGRVHKRTEGCEIWATVLITDWIRILWGEYTMDIKKIILGLEHCAKDNCKECPYDRDTSDCLGDLHRDALQYIKENEQIKEWF